ncbi:hypothetical protein AAHE18_14G186300 [Arachis hypogaea]
MDDDDVTNLTNRRGTSTTETRGAQGAPNLSTVSHDVASATGSRELGRSGRDRKVRGFRPVSPIVANPPPLLAAVFPWDRGGGNNCDGGQWRREQEGSAGSSMHTENSGQQRDGSWKAVPAPPCELATAVFLWNRDGGFRTRWVKDAEHGKKGRRDSPMRGLSYIFILKQLLLPP